jgi:ribosomal protein S18 acetylase RimI-like enzyme
MAEVSGQLVGYARTTDWTTEDGALIQGQFGFVHPQYRRRGVGGDAALARKPAARQVAWHVESNQVAGQVKPWIDSEQNETQQRRRGYTEFISIGAPWRRQGLARALVVRALHAQREAGMNESALGVDSDNAYAAARLYEACGFRVVKRNAVYRKPVDFHAGATTHERG